MREKKDAKEILARHIEESEILKTRIRSERKRFIYSLKSRDQTEFEKKELIGFDRDLEYLASLANLKLKLEELNLKKSAARLNDEKYKYSRGDKISLREAMRGVTNVLFQDSPTEKELVDKYLSKIVRDELGMSSTIKDRFINKKELSNSKKILKSVGLDINFLLDRFGPRRTISKDIEMSKKSIVESTRSRSLSGSSSVTARSVSRSPSPPKTKHVRSR